MKYNPRDPVNKIFVKAYNFAIALFFHVIDGCKKVTKDKEIKRLAKCVKCKHSENKWFECDLCGCAINEKIKWRSEKCPIEKW